MLGILKAIEKYLFLNVKTVVIDREGYITQKKGITIKNKTLTFTVEFSFQMEKSVKSNCALTKLPVYVYRYIIVCVCVFELYYGIRISSVLQKKFFFYKISINAKIV